ncbi:MAG TPA: IS1380 family transposase [Candidatus Polarisedimenticolia bacterium]|nr:IS1380 family transposase [Candidatus Polarisedimenticolia bacterium]
MRRSPRHLEIACNHAGLTHFGGISFLHEFIRVLQLRDFLARHLAYPRRNSDYSVSQMLLALIYPIILGLDRIETAKLLRANGTFQYLTGLPSFPDPQSLRRFLRNAPARLREQLHRVNDRLLERFIHLPEHRSRLIFDLDSTVLTVFGHQQGAEVGYNPRYRGKRSYDPLLCLEANSSFLWDVELRRGDAGTWAGSEELLACCFHSTPSDIRELRVRADAGFGYGPVLDMLEARLAQYAVVARMIPSLKRALRGLRFEPMNLRWEIAEFEHRPHGWPHARRCIVARKKIEESDPEPTLFTLERYAYRAWHTNLPLTPAGVWHFYDGRAGMEPRIREIREDYALRKIPTHAFAANALYLEVIRFAYNLVTAFQRTCLPEEWQSLTLSKLRHRLFWLPGELTRPQNRPTLRLVNSPFIAIWAEKILHRVRRSKPLEG